MEENYFVLSRIKIKYLFCYFSLLLIVGICLTMLGLIHDYFLSEFTITSISIIGSIGTALMGSTIFYLRKLYKSLIKNILSEPIDNKDKIMELGLVTYYFLRPVFAVSFSVIFHIALKTSVLIVTVTETNLAEGMIYFAMIISFFIGFAAGDFINKLEDYSKNIIDKAIKRF
jgi:hypothetical protein